MTAPHVVRAAGSATPLTRSFSAAALAAAILLFVGASTASGQLRPLDALAWDAMEPASHALVVGADYLSGQRASLAGTAGRLAELGVFEATWNLQRVSITLGGTLMRIFDEQSVFADPVPDTRPSDDSSRKDVGDLRVSTVVQLTAPRSRVGAALRFGVRLPTTDNAIGLGRDQTDFFSTLAGRLRAGRWDVGIEAGLGVHGTRDARHEQIDPILFALSARWDGPGFDPVLELVGQHDPRASRDRRGNEDLGEARLGIRFGEARWLQVGVIRGWTPFSPDFGVVAMVGTRF